MISRLIAWMAGRRLFATMIVVGALVIPGFVSIENQLDDLRGRIGDIIDERADGVAASEPATPGELARIIAAYCLAHDGCRGARGPAGEPGSQGTPGTTRPSVTPTPGTTTTDQPEVQDPEVQDPEVQDPEVQDPGSTGPAGPPGPAGPSGGTSCPTGFEFRTIRVPSVSNLASVLVCIRI